MASLFKIDIQKLKGVGPKSAELLRKLGVCTVGDIIKFYPKDYEDWSRVQTLGFAKGKKNQCLRLKILSDVRKNILKSGKVLYKLEATDGINFADIVFFNNRFAAQSLLKNHEYLFRGNVTGNLLKFEIISPKIKNVDDSYKIYPVYRQTKGLTSAKICSFVENAFKLLPEKITDTIPESIRQENDLCSLDFALKNIHFPNSRQDLEESRRRIVFEEFFLYQLGMCFIKKRARQKTEIVIDKEYSSEFSSFLPFELTNAQKRAVSECIKDIKSRFSMNRLLQGDVGSGKTAVSASLAYTMAKNGFQSAVMVPTETLAVQHYRTFSKFFENTEIKVEVLHSSMRTKEKRRVLQDISLGFADIVIGTHSLISEGVCFKNLGLAITDEQHRFGVNQRAKISEKGNYPHVLVMSATPIPRTLAMILYGDLDISVLDESIPGRQKVDTFRIDSSKRFRAWNFVKKIIDEGGQAYVVCACIEDNENDIADVNTYREDMIKNGFSEKDIAVLHGKMTTAEKEFIMSEFTENKIKVLVSTTVIEVGIDVPNAQIILIENAERFGISQLHQLRGRVGRSSKKSYCVLVSDAKGSDAQKRFSALVGSGDGFYLSGEDLKIRGPGDFFGTNQHGVPNIGIPTSYEDVIIMKQAQTAAENLIKTNPEMEGQEFKFIKHNIEKTFTKNDENQRIIF